MVKRPLTQVVYPLGRAPFARSIATGRGDLAVLGAVLDTLPPSPDTALLLSAQEAKAQLRGIVEGFCFRRLRNEDGKGAPRRLLIKSPPGLGETRQVIRRAVRYHLRQIGLAPQLGASQSRRNPGKFQTAV
jgi:hypothetical protein